MYFSYFIVASYGLLCYTRPCDLSDSDICIKMCPDSDTTCIRNVAVNYGHYNTLTASCSHNNCSTDPRICGLKEVNSTNSLHKMLSCCCANDYCNGWFRDAMAIYPFLTLSRPLPLLSHDNLNVVNNDSSEFFSIYNVSHQ